MPRYRPVPAHPDHSALEHAILRLWDERRTFARLVEQNRGGQTFSFVDGPITANNSMGVHHAWGRTLKDLFQRYQAGHGKELRYQNGFDCQGLWVEVEVEKSLGLNSKREIEEYGLDRFMRACRERVAEYSAVQTEQSRRLGQWMDWERSYFTMTDPNIAYIWRFLQICDERGWLYTGHRPMVWCPRCGTSLSEHELKATDSYRDVTHTSIYATLPLADAEDEHLAVWTTTPWTLPANVAAAVHPEAEYAAVRDGARLVWVMAARVEVVFGPEAEVVRRTPGSALVGRPYRGPFDDLPAVAEAAAAHRVIAWDAVGADEGTGIVHIAPGAGAEDFELGRRDGLPVLVPVGEAGAFGEGYGELVGRTTAEVPELVAAHLAARGSLLRTEEYHHSYPHCWRCATELIFRVVDEWFISADGVREQMIAASREVQWVPEHYGKRMEDWLRNMGDWCISRKRYWGLPLPFYLAPSGKVTVVGSLAELRERALEPELVDALPELHRPWIDGIRIRTDDGEIAERVLEVGDCWLDAGIVPFSTLGWENETAVAEGYAKGAGEGLTKADLPDHAYWERWFPADWVSEMREQIRLWFYSQLFMSVVLVGKAPYRSVLGYEKLHDETGRAMHKSWGNAIWFDDAVEKMGADVMRWLYAGQTPSQNMNFGYGPANDVRRRLLTLWNAYAFLVRYAEVDAFQPTWDDVASGPPAASALDRWIVARAQETATAAAESLDGFWTPTYVRAVEAFIDDLSNWYIRGSRARFWKAADDEDKQAAFRTLWYCLVQACRLIGPAMPFLAEELWQNLVADQCPDAPDSVHLAGWPAPVPALLDAERLGEMAAAQTVIRLGRAARGQRQLKLRQPLAAALVVCADATARRAVDELDELIAAELNVKEVRLVAEHELVDVEVIPNFRALGPRLGKRVPEIKALLADGAYTRDGGRIAVGGEVLEPGEYEERTRAKEGFEVAEEGAFTVAVETALSEALVDEGTARELVHHLQNLRKEAGLDVTDRIVVTVGDASAATRRVLDAYGDWLRGEVLAVELVLDGSAGAPFADGEATASLAVARAG